MSRRNNTQDQKVAEYDSTHVVYIDPDTGNLEIYRRSAKDARAHAERLRSLNNRNADFWRKRMQEQFGE